LIVVICLPSAALTGNEHERVATPSMCAALRDPATVFRAGHADIFSNDPLQRRVGFYIDVVFLTVDNQTGHAILRNVGEPRPNVP
jgi:hypothetical protein